MSQPPTRFLTNDFLAKHGRAQTRCPGVRVQGTPWRTLLWVRQRKEDKEDKEGSSAG